MSTDWPVSADFVVVAPAPAGQQERVLASTARRELACSKLDIGVLSTFRDRWFESLGAERRRGPR